MCGISVCLKHDANCRESCPSSTTRAGSPSDCSALRRPSVPLRGCGEVVEAAGDQFVVVGNALDHQFRQLGATPTVNLSKGLARAVSRMSSRSTASWSTCSRNRRSVSVNSVPKRSLRRLMISDSGALSSSGSPVPTAVGPATVISSSPREMT